MMKLQKTTRFGKGKAAHHHIVFINDQTGEAICSFAAGHDHPIQFVPPAEGLDDGQEIQTPSVGGFLLLPSADGHIHEIIDYELQKEKEEKITDEEICWEVLEQYKTWKDWERESFEEAEKAEAFVTGDQWDDNVRANLETLNRACLTIDYTTRTVDELCGYQREQKSGFSYSPVGDGDQIAADMYTQVASYIKERCYYEAEKSDTFEDAVYVGRGLFNIYMDFDNNLEGDIKIERYSWPDVVFAPHDKKNLDDCEGLIKHKWFSQAKFKQFWPDKAKQMVAALDSADDTTKTHEDISKDAYEQGTSIPLSLSGDPTVDVRKREIKVYERWLKVYEKVTVAVRQENDFYFNTFGWKKSDVDQIGTIPGFVLVEKTIKKIRITRCTAAGLLSDENPADVPVEDFFIVPLYYKKRGGKWWGKVRSLIDPQKEINHRHSQAVDIGNKMAAYGWFVDEGTFTDSKEEKKFQDNSSSPGFISKVQDLSRTPKQVEGVKFPSEIVQLLEQGKSQIYDIGNVTAIPSTSYESGPGLVQKQRMKIIGTEFLFDNLFNVQVKIGRLLLQLIRKYYDTDRIYDIVAAKAQSEEITLGGEPFQSFTKETIQTILEDDDVANYDVAVIESEASPTTRLGVFMMLSELAQSGTPIPPEILIEFLDVPQGTKDKILSSIAAQQEAQSTQQQQVKEMEENKTLINQGIIPPDVQQRLTVSQQNISQGDLGNGNGSAIPQGSELPPLAGM